MTFSEAHTANVKTLQIAQGGLLYDADPLRFLGAPFLKNEEISGILMWLGVTYVFPEMRGYIHTLSNLQPRFNRPKSGLNSISGLDLCASCQLSQRKPMKRPLKYRRTYAVRASLDFSMKRFNDHGSWAPRQPYQQRPQSVGSKNRSRHSLKWASTGWSEQRFIIPSGVT